MCVTLSFIDLFWSAVSKMLLGPKTLVKACLPKAPQMARRHAVEGRKIGCLCSFNREKEATDVHNQAIQRPVSHVLAVAPASPQTRICLARGAQLMKL